MIRNKLDTEVQFLPGVGPKRASLLKSELGVSTVGDLLHTFPFRYIDRSSIQPISGIQSASAYVQILAQVVSSQVNGKKLSVMVKDQSGVMELVFFRGIKYTYDRLKPGSVFLFFGKPNQFNGRFNMVHPEVDNPPSGGASGFSGVLTGVYNSTDRLRNGGVTGKVMNRLIAEAIDLAIGDVEETLPEYILREKGLVPLKYAIRNVHFPSDQNALEKARYRLKWEELFLLQLSLLKQKYVRSRSAVGIPMPKVGVAFNACYNALPYELTGAQKRVIKEIRSDMMSGHQMNRLLQGDVGSGKTMVAVLSALIAVGNGFQACIMAPTEVLAQQHFANIYKYLAPTGVRCELLIGSTGKAARRPILEGLADGSVGIIIGTHALIEDTVIFRNLGLAIIDEQHRFGVDQRARLWAKGAGGVPPHVLVMTATPIPRTLAMTFYGDLDVSVIDEMPPGRKPIQTMLIGEGKRPQLYNFMKKEIAAGRQVFVVYPLIFESEKVDYQNLEAGYEDIVSRFPFPPYKVAIVHGRQTSEVKQFNMDAFAAGRANILVSTTVIEVGVDVPNASVMVIESAERFGLSQLHQLRGRVGRGAEQSYCILVSSYKLSNDTRKRLEIMVNSNDGFRIAEEDLRLRGHGDLEGTRQSGEGIDLKIANLATDGQILQYARELAQEVLDKDPDLMSETHRILNERLKTLFAKKKDWSLIS